MSFKLIWLARRKQVCIFGFSYVHIYRFIYGAHFSPLLWEELGMLEEVKIKGSEKVKGVER